MSFESIGKAVVWGLVFLAIFVFLFAWPVQLLWNSIVPDLFHLRPITFWESVRLVFLFDLLVKSKPTKNKE